MCPSNGWYFTRPSGAGARPCCSAGCSAGRGSAIATVRLTPAPVADRLFFREAAARSAADVLVPVSARGRDVPSSGSESASAAELARWSTARRSGRGDSSRSFTLCGGAAWRFEDRAGPLSSPPSEGQGRQSYQVLLGGLGFPGTNQHSVHSLDWFRETIGELPSAARGPQQAAARHEEAAGSRRPPQRLDCRRRSAPRPRLQLRFAALLALAQRYAAIRAEQAAWFTLGLARAAAVRPPTGGP